LFVVANRFFLLCVAGKPSLLLLCSQNTKRSKGSCPVRMSYDGDFTGVEKINVGLELHFVIVDLCAEKSTTEILEALQSAYPFASTDLHRNLQRCLGETNLDLCDRMLAFLSSQPKTEEDHAATVAAIGALLSEAQVAFDAHAGAVCPNQLTAPVLHKCLSWPNLQPLIVGGKGVGAGGDGTAQLLCKNAAAASEVARIVKEELRMDPLLLTISPGTKVRTALMAAGGFAGKLFPASQASKAELFPVLDPKDGLLKPLLLITVEQLLEAGLEKVVIIVQEEDLPQFKRLFNSYVTPANARRLPPGKHESYSRKVIDVGRHVSFVVQKRQMGFGHAVYCAREVVGENPFLLVLGHHMYLPLEGNPRSCAEQVLDAYNALGGSNVLGLKHTPAESVSRFGCATGVVRPKGHAGLSNTVLSVTNVIERPDRAFAETNLRVEGLDEGEFLTVFGIYALNNEIFDLLQHDVENDIRDEKGEIAFTPALDRLRQSSAGLSAIVVDGERLPIDTPEGYIRTNARLLELYEQARN
jgi:UTP-glucose-1-phosphate uridylyltransferase